MQHMHWHVLGTVLAAMQCSTPTKSKLSGSCKGAVGQCWLLTFSARHAAAGHTGALAQAHSHSRVPSWWCLDKEERSLPPFCVVSVCVSADPAKLPRQLHMPIAALSTSASTSAPELSSQNARLLRKAVCEASR